MLANTHASSQDNKFSTRANFEESKNRESEVVKQVERICQVEDCNEKEYLVDCINHCKCSYICTKHLSENAKLCPICSYDISKDDRHISSIKNVHYIMKITESEL